MKPAQPNRVTENSKVSKKVTAQKATRRKATSKKVKGSKLPVWLSHLLWLPALIGLFATGLQISASNQLESSAHAIRQYLPMGEMHEWHLLFAGAFLTATLLYLIHQAVSGRFQRLKLKGKKLFLNAETVLRGLIWLGLICLLISAATGLTLLLTNNRAAELNQIHHFSAWACIVFLVLHILVAVLARKFTGALTVFIPRKPLPSSLVWVGVVVLAVPATLYALTPSTQNTLQVVFTQQAIELDGEARETDWNHAPSVSVKTFNGRNHENGSVIVNVRALHDGEYGYFLFEWADKTRSLAHLPLIKTDEGWRVQQTGAGKADENEFYEDKFAVMLSRTSQLAGAGTVHLGKKPHSERPASMGGRGLHYTTDGSITDVWHWKAVRTGGIGQADDNHFGRPLPSKSEYKRYTGGYQKDLDCEHKVRFEGNDFRLKPECGGYLMNWKIYSDEIVQPLRLPKNQQVLARMGTPNMDPSQSDQGRWWLAWNDTVRYSPDADTFPIGTVIPSVISLGRFTMGRGGVDAVGSWNNGKWTLELRRKLHSNDQHDLPIEDGIYLWMAAFDHSQTRHTYHMRPLRLAMEQTPATGLSVSGQAVAGQAATGDSAKTRASR
ncbi:ethylbenzene dehydrogenase-related protein [Corallincola platygyrae]|uniref:Ethylbenzene dehydrogenase-related protein n=1 Tax=Corallincola platygyrae TaxID=1193278 RepID=A0ABW4XRQ8_9GAMM